MLVPDAGSGSGGDPYVFFSFDLPNNIPSGTVITLDASLTYGTDTPISLSPVSYTIDNTPPTSSVQALPAASSPSFTVSWSGQASEGVGIAFYDVYMAEDGGPFTVWQAQTTATAAVFTGQQGHSYSFYSVATDDVANVQPMPTQAQAQTEIVSVLTNLSEAASTTTPVAESIATMLAGHYNDPDGSKNTKPGIAVTATSGNGNWQYNNGNGWVNVGPVSTTNALLLPQADRLRFLPTGLATGQAGLVYAAWDGSEGSAGSYFNAATTGGGTPFSSNVGGLTVTLTPVTAAPVWLASSATLAPISPGVPATPAGQTVQSRIWQPVQRRQRAGGWHRNHRHDRHE